MSGNKPWVSIHPFKITCPSCSKESTVTIDIAITYGLVCECGKSFDTEALLQAATGAKDLIEKMIHDAGFH